MITNAAALATSQSRKDVLSILQSGLDAIDTKAVIATRVVLAGTTLTIDGHHWDLNVYAHIYMIGIGKASCEAASALEHVLGNRLTSGLVLSSTPKPCTVVEVLEATHPMPSPQNVTHSQRVVALAKQLTEQDLVIAVISGGGSAMLCWPDSEREQGSALYEASNRAGLTITELNTVRKHLSALKGGGLAATLAPATVIGLIFSDVPSSTPEIVASGPTYPDATTVADAQAIIDRYHLGDYRLTETPKDPALFTKVTNIVLVSNATALGAMEQQANALGYKAVVVGDSLLDSVEHILKKIQSASSPHSVVLAGGEAQFTIADTHGSGGRNQHVALVALQGLTDGQVFAGLASDGRDNSDVAGALVDVSTRELADQQHLNLAEHASHHDEYPLFAALGAHLMTGPTGANVSDFYLLMTS